MADKLSPNEAVAMDHARRIITAKIYPATTLDDLFTELMDLLRLDTVEVNQGSGEPPLVRFVGAWKTCAACGGHGQAREV